MLSIFKSKPFGCLLISLALFSCQSETESLVDKADQEALRQKSQLAHYLYAKAIEEHQARDHTRYRALKGLATVSMTQLHDYRTAVRAMEQLFEEYSQVSRYKEEIQELRSRAAYIWRVNLQEPHKALDVISPLVEIDEPKPQWLREMGHIYVDKGNYEEAEKWYKKAWNLAKETDGCDILGPLQLDLMQIFSVRDQCEDTLRWSQKTPPKECGVDEFSIAVKKAHCYEVTGEITKAVQLYEELLRENPDNLRAQFFLEALKARQEEREI